MARAPVRYKIRHHNEKHKNSYRRPGDRFQRSDLRNNFKGIREVHFLRFEFQSFGPNNIGNFVYLGYRTLFAAAVLTIFFVSTTCSTAKLSMLYIYINQWSILLQMIYGVLFFISVLYTTFHHCCARDEPEPEEIMNAEYTMVLESRGLGRREKVVWFFHNISVGVSMMVGLNFYFVGNVTKFGPIRECNEETVFAAFGMTSILSLVDMFMCAIPIRLGHAMYTMITVATYLTFAVIYELAGGEYYCKNKSDACQYIYEIIDFAKRPGHAAISFLLYSLAPGAFHVILFLLFKLRLLLYSYTCKKEAFLDHQYPFVLTTGQGSTSRGYFGMTDPDNPFPKRILINDGLPISRAAALEEVQKVRLYGVQSRQNINYELEPLEFVTPFPKSFSGEQRDF